MLSETELLERALELPATQRAAIAQRLLESLDAEAPDSDADEAWADEIERRAAAYDRGEMEASDAGEAIERVRQSLGRGRQT